MSIQDRNRSIARLIVGAMSIEGTLGDDERERVAETLRGLGMDALIPEVGLAIEEADGSYNLFEECGVLEENLGHDAKDLVPRVFRIVADVLATDRFVSEQEATYLSAMARKLDLPAEEARRILTEVIHSRRSHIEVAGSSIEESLHPHLKELLSFEGAEEIVGRIEPGSIEALLDDNRGKNLSPASANDLHAALGTLGLTDNATLEDATLAWREVLERTNLSKLADAGDSFVASAIDRAGKVNAAYQTVKRFFQSRMPLSGGASGVALGTVESHDEPRKLT